MKTLLASTTASALLLGLAAFATQPAPARLIEGKDQPILLKRMVVTATPL